ncbi:MAG: DUF2304 domain-containing protein [Candidatus Dormibacteraeota bacterium]|nr:DUF2304 domain-containing protein [Candidatus Dormibacteraeota bacterium]
MTSLRVRLIVLAVALLFLLFIALQVRWRRLRARYLVLWAAICILVIPIVIIPAVANGISSALGIYYPPATLFLIAIIVLFAINFQFSREITRLEERTRILAEELALQRVTEDKPFSDPEDVAAEPARPAAVRGGR